MKKDNSTPRPWRLSPEAIYGANGENVHATGDSFLSDADAELIVKAVNAHGALVEALKQLMKEVNQMSNAPEGVRTFGYMMGIDALKLAE